MIAQEEAMGKVYVLHGEMIAAGEHFERALILTRDLLVRARLQSEAANSLVATGDPRGLEHLREALSVLDPKINPLETANALAIEGRFHHLAGQHKRAIELLTQAAELVASSAEADIVSSFAASTIPTIYGWLAGAYQHSGLFSDADVWARRALEFGNSHNVLFAQALGHEFLGEDALNRGEYSVANDHIVLGKRLLDEALQTGLENFKEAETLGLLYSRAEARRTLAHVRFRRGELVEAERLCAEALQLISDTKSRVSRLWLGPLYIEVLLALGKRTEAAEHLERYRKFVAECQSPRFEREAARLAASLKTVDSTQ